MSSAQHSSTLRMIVASFAAGVGAMALVSTLTLVAMNDGLALRDAAASTLEQKGPAVEPLDLPAVEAQLALAKRNMETTRAATEHAMGRLERLSGR